MIIMKKIATIAFGLILFASCSEAQTPSQATNDEPQVDQQAPQQEVINKVLSPAEYKEMLEKEGIQLVDVRTPGEYSGGYINDAQNIDYMGSDFKTKIAELDKSKTTLIYCASGGRSAKAAAIMKDLGFKEVYDLRGGYNGWPHK